jgi:energy-converting hydrogenase A subunit R
VNARGTRARALWGRPCRGHRARPRRGWGRLRGRPKRLYATDLGGPVAKNDNALELAAAVVPRGAELFRRVSLYDEYLAEVVRRPGYRAGDTLRLMLPFLLAHGLDDARMRALSAEGILVVPRVGTVLRELAAVAPVYIVSASYCPYVHAVCAALGLSAERAFCTRVGLAAYRMPAEEAEQVRAMAATILRRDPIAIPEGARGPIDLGERDRATVKELDYVFWERMPRLRAGRVLEEVRCLRGPEKALSVRAACEREGSTMCEVMYVGDSITDAEAFRLVHREGGLTVSFNGDRWAVKEADVAIVADRADAVLDIARGFLGGGHDAVKALRWPLDGDGWTAHWVHGSDINELVERSEAKRKQVRGEAIGAPG